MDSGVAHRRATQLAAAAAVAVVVHAAFRRRRARGARAALPGVEARSPRAFSKDKRSFTWKEVSRHCLKDDAWIVIDGAVYDATPFLSEHPGGNRLLLAFAGKDATDAFLTAGHSAVARRELQQLHLGQLLPGGQPGLGRSMPRDAQLTGGIVKGTSCADFSAALAEGSAVWKVDKNGFMPARDPVGVEALNGTCFEPFVDLGDELPALGLTGAFRRRLDADKDLQDRLRRCGDKEALDTLSEDQLERAFGLVSYTMIAYWRGGILTHDPTTFAKPEASATSHLPSFLAAPMLALSDRLGRPPMVDYAATVLYNWTRIDKDGPIEPSNLRCIHRLTGLLDEEWFFKTHVVIESEAAHAVSAIACATENTEEDDDSDSALLGHLVALEEALWRVVRACMPLMYERDDEGTPKLSEHIFYHNLRPLIGSGRLVFDGDSKESAKPLDLAGPSGAMSSLLPCIDAALGIETTSEKLRMALKKFELSMPREHRDFLSEMRGRTSIRQRLVVSRPRAGAYSEHHEALVRAFNRCISRVLDFRWQHWSFVKHFIMKPGNLSYTVGSGGTSFDFLQQHITDTEKARLAESSDAISKAYTPAEDAEWPSFHQPMITQYPTQDFWSVDGQRGLLSREPLSGPDQPWAREQPLPVQTALETLWGLAAKIPALTASCGPYIERCEAASERLAPLQDVRVLLRLPEVARESLMTTLSHISASCLSITKQGKAPSCIDKPFKVIAQSVGRPPRLDLTELALCNWSIVSDEDDIREATMEISGEPTAGGETAAGGEAEVAAGHEGQRRHVPAIKELRVAWHFLASPDELWYRAVHIRLHHEARDAIAAVRIGQVGMRDQRDGAVVGGLVKLSLWLNKSCNYFDSYFERKDSRTESLMMRRLEPFVANWGRRNYSQLETACWVFCSGCSVLIPALHAFLGIKMYHSGTAHNSTVKDLEEMFVALQEEMRALMPVMHREFLEELERPGASVRQYCFRRFGGRSTSVEQLHDLEVAYNDSVNALLRFLSRRVHLVCRFFPQHATGFGAWRAEVEASMRGSRLQLLRMRQHVDRCLEPDHDKSLWNGPK